MNPAGEGSGVRLNPVSGANTLATILTNRVLKAS
jgi:hypothetical protein